MRDFVGRGGNARSPRLCVGGWKAAGIRSKNGQEKNFGRLSLTLTQSQEREGKKENEEMRSRLKCGGRVRGKSELFLFFDEKSRGDKIS